MQRKPKQQESRVRIDPELYQNLKELQTQLGFKTLTQLIEFLIDEYIKIQPTEFEEVQQNIPNDSFWANVINLLFMNGLIDTNMLLHATQTDPNTHNQLRQILLQNQSDNEINNILTYQQVHHVNLFQNNNNYMNTNQMNSNYNSQMNTPMNQMNMMNTQMNQNQMNRQMNNSFNPMNNQMNQNMFNHQMQMNSQTQQMQNNPINRIRNQSNQSDIQCPSFNPQSSPCSQRLCFTFSNYMDENGHFHSQACCPKQN